MNLHNATSRLKKRKKHQPSTPWQPKLGNQDRAAQQSAASLSQRDDLFDIPSIDPATELALNSIGIRRFADFARYTPETLAKALQERTGLTVMAETIANEAWIGSAAILATASDGAGKPSENISTQNISNTTISDDTTAVNKNDSEILQPGQNEEKENGAVWIQHAAFTPMETPAQPNRPATKFIRSEMVIGAGTTAVGAERTPLCAQVHAVDTATGEHKLLAAQAERLQPSQMEYPVQLEFAVPGIGRYQLHIIAFLLQPEAEIAFYQGPILRVMA